MPSLALIRCVVFFRARTWLLPCQCNIWPVLDCLRSYGIPVGESFIKAFLEEWILVGDESSDEQNVTGPTDYIRDDHPPTPRQRRQPVFLPWEPTKPEDKAYFLERMQAPLPFYTATAQM